MNDPASTNGAADRGAASGFPGRWLVLGMAGFAVVAVSTLYVYWRLHRAPFLELQQALAVEFPGSRPLVEGGQRKSHEGTPRMLRVVMEVEFDPNEPALEPRVDRLFDDVLQLLRSRRTLEAYDQFHLHLFQQERERELREHTVSLDLATGRRCHAEGAEPDCAGPDGSPDEVRKSRPSTLPPAESGGRRE